MESNVTQLAIHERLWAWAELHRKEVLWGAAIVTIAGLGIGFVLWRQEHRQTVANEALSRALSIELARLEPEQVPAALLRIAEQHPRTDAGGRALLLGAADLFAHGKYAEAKTQFEKHLGEYPESPFTDQAHLGVAVCLEMLGRTNDAQRAYNDVVQHHSAGSVAAQARYALARMYEAENKLDQARDLYQQLRMSGSGTIAMEAGMRLEDLIARNPNLAPPRTVSTNLPVMNLGAP